MNLYGYVMGDPINIVDSSGLQGMSGRNIPQPQQLCLVEIFGGECIWGSTISRGLGTFSWGNKLVVGGDIEDFLKNDPWTTLHEYYHICRQWSKSEYGSFFWKWLGATIWSLLSSFDLHENSPYERAASECAHRYIREYTECIHEY